VKTLTIHDALVAALVGRGAKLTPYATKRYTALSWPSEGRPLFFFVGRNGSLRMGANVTDSIPVPPRLQGAVAGRHHHLCQQGRRDMKTIHDRLVEALIARGFEVVSYVTRRYTVLTRSGVTFFFFVGRAGALRAGRTIRLSRPVPPTFKARLLAGTATTATTATTAIQED
jgi:hypothetical protein